MSNIDIFDFASNALVSTDSPPLTSVNNNMADCITETIEDIKFNNDGSKVFLLHRTDNHIVEYNLVNPYDLTDISSNGGVNPNASDTTCNPIDGNTHSKINLLNFNINSSTTQQDANSFIFNQDGTKLIYNNDYDTNIIIIDLATGYDLTSADLSNPIIVRYNTLNFVAGAPTMRV